MYQLKKYGVKLIVLFASSMTGGAAFAECGVASYYWQGKITANGERYHADGISAAHKTLPFGTEVLVKHQRSGKSMVLRINDRGPYIKGRIIDLSRGANRIFGMDGVAPVCISVISYGNGRYVGNTGRTRVAGVSRRKNVRLASATSRRKSRVTLASLSERRKMRVARRAQPVRSASVKARRYSAKVARANARQAAAQARREARG
ncbi:MAG: septal ring lytic transglycosylase RlpA family protein [Hyphomicrobiales bacterium]|nr:septal ring lytic transglycosylase RlpA family protein [Hyphomicrobiales bacterium]